MVVHVSYGTELIPYHAMDGFKSKLGRPGHVLIGEKVGPGAECGQFQWEELEEGISGGLLERSEGRRRVMKVGRCGNGEC